MLRGLWTMLAVGCVFAVTGLSMAMNYSFGYSLGTSELNSRIFAALSVAFDGLKCVLPLFIAWQASERRWLRAALGTLVFALLIAYGSASAVGFAAENRSAVAGERDTLNVKLVEAKGDLDAATTRLTALAAHRLTGVIEAELAAQKKERLWQTTNGCTDMRGSAAREFCKKHEMTRGELSLAVEDARLGGIIEALKARIAALRSQGAGRESDAQAAAMAFMGLSPSDVRRALSWLIAITVEAISAFGLFIILRGDRLVATAKKVGSDGTAWRLVRKAARRTPIWALQGGG